MCPGALNIEKKLPFVFQEKILLEWQFRNKDIYNMSKKFAPLKKIKLKEKIKQLISLTEIQNQDLF
uniref:Uncharacterized protein n=1 Tax=Rhizophagus irregularis (strain DAOM 181602 / DAOM 197198 / MUCL 43194) TaxID=747089 RepID=U9TLW0_RHIID